MRVALVQLAAGIDPAANLDAVLRLTHDVEADLIVLPEAVMCDFGPLRCGWAGRAAAGRPVRPRWPRSRDRGAGVVAGMFERSDDPERPYNTLVALARTAHWPAPTGRRTSTTPSATGSPND